MVTYQTMEPEAEAFAVQYIATMSIPLELHGPQVERTTCWPAATGTTRATVAHL